MKKLILFCALALLLGTAAANPVVSRYIARVWFDDAEDFHVLFGDEAFWYMFDVGDLSFTTSAGTYYLPATYAPPVDPVFLINLSQEIPGFTIQRNADFLRLDGDELLPEEVRWGPQTDLSVHLRPLGPGQSAVQVRIDTFNGYEYNSVNTWAKDNQIICPTPYEPVSTYALNVHLEDESGAPAAGVPIYCSNVGYASANEPAWGCTDASGNWQGTDIPLRRSILVNDPQTGDPLIQELIFPEPGETLQFSAVVSSTASDDPVLSPTAGVLKLRPTVFNAAQGTLLSLAYESAKPLTGKAELRLYDLRGRHLASRELPASGQAEWDLAELKSGIYFVALHCGGEKLARARLTVLK